MADLIQQLRECAEGHKACGLTVLAGQFIAAADTIERPEQERKRLSLTWTAEVPTVDGDYWLKEPNIKADIVRVEHWHHARPEMIVVMKLDGSLRHLFASDIPADWQWAAIPLPTEPATNPLPGEVKCA